MMGPTHRIVTKTCFRTLESICPGIELTLGELDTTAAANSNTDRLEDLLFMAGDVEFDQFFTGGNLIDIEPTYKVFGKDTTAFNHFIDIRKADLRGETRGIVDDFDGYSYKRGSASLNQYEPLSNVCYEFGVGKDVVEKTKLKTDHGFSLFLGLPGSRVVTPLDGGYSDVLRKYSYFQENSSIQGFSDEMNLRFSGTIAEAVFMPVDQLGRYWYEYFVQTGELEGLGHLLHAVQDASVPHHAAGCMGNYHSDYELQLGVTAGYWCCHELEFETAHRQNVLAWCRWDDSPPDRLSVEDWARMPAMNWRIDHLITWVALNAYRSYARAFNHFKDGLATHPSVLFKKYKQLKDAYEDQLGRFLTGLFDLDEGAWKAAWRAVLATEEERERLRVTLAEMRGLVLLGVSMSTLVLMKANSESVLRSLNREVTPEDVANYALSVAANQTFPHFMGNRRSKELHRPECAFIGLMAARNRLPFLYLQDAWDNGYDGCRFCMPDHHTK
jgi:hypothetical protein